MKTRESGMPEEEMWRAFFDVGNDPAIAQSDSIMPGCCGVRLRLRNLHHSGRPNRARHSPCPGHRA